MLEVMKVAKLAIILTASQIIDESLMNPDVLYPYDKNVVEFCDSNFRPILPTKLSRVDSVGHGIFLGWSINPDDKYQYGNERILFTKDGKHLAITVPKGTKLVQVFWLGQEAEQNPQLQLSDLPKDTILRYIAEDHTFGLCDIHGKEFLPERFGCIGKVSEGKAFVSDKGIFTSPIKSSRFFIFDCATKNLKQLPLNNVHRTEDLVLSEGLTAFDASMHLFKNGIAPSYAEEATWNESGYIDGEGKLAILGKYASAGPFHSGMASVNLAKPTENGRVSVIIDKTGKIVSPESVEVQQFYGDYAIARHLATRPPKYGIVNRKFEFVVQPKYESVVVESLPNNNELANSVERFTVQQVSTQ